MSCPIHMEDASGRAASSPDRYIRIDGVPAVPFVLAGFLLGAGLIRRRPPGSLVCAAAVADCEVHAVARADRPAEAEDPRASFEGGGHAGEA